MIYQIGTRCCTESKLGLSTAALRLDDEWHTELPLKRIWSLASEESD